MTMIAEPNELLPAVILSQGPGALGATRALSRRGVPVTTIGFDRQSPIQFTRYTKCKILIENTSALDREKRLLEVMRNLPVERAALLFSSDEMVEFVVKYRAELAPKFRFTLPSNDLLRALNDKKQETSLVHSLGIPLPKTIQYLPTTPESLMKELRLPIIFKPSLYTQSKEFPFKNIVVYNEEQLNIVYSDWRHMLPHFIAQEVIPGPESACWICSCTFDAEHRLLDCGIKQKLRAHPPRFGISSVAVSKNNPEILKITQQLGTALCYVGHASIEFRLDERDNEYKYIEINPRLPANVCFEEACGLPTVWNSYQVALHGKTNDTSLSTQREGVYFVDFLADYYGQTEDGIGKLKALWSTTRYLFRPSAGQYFEWRDPMPGLYVCYLMTKQKLSQARLALSNKLRLSTAA
jgi:D-aspartate ligase